MRITLGPDKPYIEEEPKPVCEFCKKPIENYFSHLSLEKECEMSKWFRRWCLILFITIKNLKDRIKHNPSEIKPYEESIVSFLSNAGFEIFSFFQMINILLETISRSREKIGYHESIFEEIEEFLSLILNFTSLVYTEAEEEKSHEAEAFLNENGEIYRLIVKGYGGISDFYVSIEPSEVLSDIFYCSECKRMLSFNFNHQKTNEKFIKFYEIKNELLSTNIPEINLNSESSLRNYLDSIGLSLFFDFINILIARKLIGKLDQPIISLGDEEKDFLKNLNTIIKFLNENQWFRALVYYFQKNALLVDFSEFILNNIKDFIALISNPNNIQIFEFDVIKSLKLEDYESFQNFILFLRFTFSAINENNPEKLLKSLENIKSIINTYICPFCSRIYLLLVNGKYIVFGEDYLEIGDFVGKEIKQCFKTSPNHYVVKIYPDELS